MLLFLGVFDLEISHLFGGIRWKYVIFLQYKFAKVPVWVRHWKCDSFQGLDISKYFVRLQDRCRN